ncbi:hypothetical protein AXX17_AT1G09850 [Arabidopsis thaliana]|uniref:Uncharacterized protein n=1 Tax=Arabidopsis thaliana TaxID=3702 RepID=A0A178W628_ARATH|nr:hypothetical protein AXX17_AT1G09850 [Arabidopsis thaliana]
MIYDSFHDNERTVKTSSEVFSLLSPQVALKSSLFFGRRLTFGGSYSTNVDLL